MGQLGRILFRPEKWHFHDPLGIHGIRRHCGILAGIRCPDCWLRFPSRINRDIKRISLSLSLSFSCSLVSSHFYRVVISISSKHARSLSPLCREFDFLSIGIYRPIYNLRRLQRNAMSMFVACQTSLICERSIGNRLESRNLSNLYRAKKF